MEIPDDKNSAQCTSDNYNSDEQLLANMKNKFNLLSNPSAESPLLFISKRKHKMIRKSSIQSVTLYNIHRKVINLIHRIENNPNNEEQIEWMVQTAIETGKISTRKLKAAVATAVYITHRLNHTEIMLNKIMKLYNVRCSDISKCMTVFKDIGIYKELDSLPLWPIYQQLIDFLLPYDASEKEIRHSDIKCNNAETMIIPLCEINPIRDTMPLIKDTKISTKSIRDQMIDIGRKLIDLPEIKLSKQGSLPQSLVAGIFMVAAKTCGAKFQLNQIAKRLGLCETTVAQSKRTILEILEKKSGDNNLDYMKDL